MKNAVSECFSVDCQIQHGESGNEFEAAFRHFAFSGRNFVEDNLRREKFVLRPPQVPPVAGELLAGGLQNVAGRARNEIARNRALNVNAHGRRLHPPFVGGGKNVGGGRKRGQTLRFALGRSSPPLALLRQIARPQSCHAICGPPQGGGQ